MTSTSEKKYLVKPECHREMVTSTDEISVCEAGPVWINLLYMLNKETVVQCGGRKPNLQLRDQLEHRVSLFPLESTCQPSRNRVWSSENRSDVICYF